MAPEPAEERQAGAVADRPWGGGVAPVPPEDRGRQAGVAYRPWGGVAPVPPEDRGRQAGVADRRGGGMDPVPPEDRGRPAGVACTPDPRRLHSCADYSRPCAAGVAICRPSDRFLVLLTHPTGRPPRTAPGRPLRPPPPADAGGQDPRSDRCTERTGACRLTSCVYPAETYLAVT